MHTSTNRRPSFLAGALRWASEWVPSMRRSRARTAIPLREAFPATTREQLRESYVVPTPEAPSMPMWRAAARELQGPTLEMPSLLVAEVPDGLFCPANHALLTSARAVVAESVGTEHPQHPFRPDALQHATIAPLPGVATSLRAFRWNYYHMLVDCLPRLALLKASRWAPQGEVQLLYAGPEPTPPERAMVRAFGLANTRFVRVEENRLYRVERYLMLPFLSRQFSGYLPPWYVQQVRTRLLPARPPRHNRRIVLSRAGATKRRIRNEAELLAALAPLGFEAVAPETLSFDEQIELFYDAEAVVAPHGAGLTNLLFADGARVLELFPTPYVVPHFYYLCRAVGLSYQYLCGQQEHRDDDFSVDVSRVHQLLASSRIITATT